MYIVVIFTPTPGYFIISSLFLANPLAKINLLTYFVFRKIQISLVYFKLYQKENASFIAAV